MATAAPKTTLRRLLRAAALGLLFAFFAAGIALVGLAAGRLLHPMPCGTLSPNECALEREGARELAHDQLFEGAAFLLLAAALDVVVRRSPGR